MPSTLKTENFFKKNVMVAYVHIEYSTYQFSEESKGGGSGILRGLTIKAQNGSGFDLEKVCSRVVEPGGVDPDSDFSLKSIHSRPI